MKSKLTRRRFGQIAIASTAVGITGYFANRALAKPSLLDTTNTLLETNLINVIYGVKVQDKGLIVQTLNLVTPPVLSTVSGLTDRITLDPGDQLGGFTSLSDGTLVVLINPSRTSKKEDYSPRLIFLGLSPTTVTVTGLKKKEELGDIQGTKEKGLVGLVHKSKGNPPVQLASINPRTGEAKTIDSFPGNQRVRNLAESPDGTIYTTTLDKDGNTVLGNKQLVLDNSNWVSGLKSLICSSSTKFYGLGTTRYGLINYLYEIDATTGKMTEVTEFPVNKMTLIRV